MNVICILRDRPAKIKTHFRAKNISVRSKTKRIRDVVCKRTVAIYNFDCFNIYVIKTPYRSNILAESNMFVVQLKITVFNTTHRYEFMCKYRL